MNVFVTGFGPFQGVRDNPSATLARQSGPDHAVLEVAFEAVDAFVANFTGFDALLLLGVAVKRDAITPELMAWNRIGPAPDVRGERREGPIAPDGPLVRRATLWDDGELARWWVGGDARPSFHPGAYLCNYALYRALERLACPVGFLHVPQVPDGAAFARILDDLRRRPDRPAEAVR